MFNTDLTHAQVHAHVHREGERFLRFANVLLLAFKVPNIDHDPSLLKQALLSVRSFYCKTFSQAIRFLLALMNYCDGLVIFKTNAD